MKKLLTLSVLCVIMLANTAVANTGDLFNEDIEQIKTQMSDLDQLDQYLDLNEGLSYSDIQASNVSKQLDLDMSILSGSNALLEPPLGIPSFAWGCVLGVWGILLVYLIAEDSDETKKAAMGCLVGYAAGAVFYLIYYFAVLATYSTI